MIFRVDSGKIIPVVDDEPASLGSLVKYLGAAGLNALVATEGSSAIRMVDSEHPDLALLDIRLPDMKGYEVCRQIESSEQGRKIPVIFNSAPAETDEKAEGFRAGGIDYLTKPLQSAC